jgi:large subunit ribosomal protein L18e
MRTTYSTNEELQSIIAELRKASCMEKINLWKRVAADLSKPSRQRRAVNLSRIDRYTKDSDVIIVPGKVLSAGDLNHKVDVAAFSFSKSAKDKIIRAQGKALSISELIKKNPKAQGIKIIG